MEEGANPGLRDALSTAPTFLLVKLMIIGICENHPLYYPS